MAFDPNWKLLQPDDVAGLVSYLVKEESRFVTGEPFFILVSPPLLFDYS